MEWRNRREICREVEGEEPVSYECVVLADMDYVCMERERSGERGEWTRAAVSPGGVLGQG
jgi:hypothetical protein